MSYCRFSEGDIYMFYNTNGTIECCACSLAPKVKTIFTTGLKKEDSQYKLFGALEACTKCEGEGCDSCMIHGSLNFETFEEAIEHLHKHVANGDYVPKRAFEELQYDLQVERKPTAYKG
jgi:hypothetical protein